MRLKDSWQVSGTCGCRSVASKSTTLIFLLEHTAKALDWIKVWWVWRMTMEYSTINGYVFMTPKIARSRNIEIAEILHLLCHVLAMVFKVWCALPPAVGFCISGLPSVLRGPSHSEHVTSWLQGHVKNTKPSGTHSSSDWEWRILHSPHVHVSGLKEEAGALQANPRGGPENSAQLARSQC